MKREILFRGKRNDNGEWVEGSLGYNSRYRTHHITVHNRPTIPSDMSVEVNPATVGQFTGLTDRNGDMVFEGDILKICNGSINLTLWMDKNREVIFKDGAFLVPTWDFDSTHWFEVIGNIHDNLELV